MNRMFLRIGVVASLSLGSMLQATVTVPPCASGSTVLCFNFGGNPGIVPVTAGTGGGSTFFSAPGTNGAGQITVYGEQVNSTGHIVTPGTIGGVSTMSGLFQVNTTVFNNGTGVAPYDPYEGSGNSMSAQQGIEDFVDGTANSNILELGINRAYIPDGTTLSFLMQSGLNLSDTVAIFTGLVSGPADLNTVPNTTVAGDLNAINNGGTSSLTNPFGNITTSGMTSQFSITTSTSAAHPIEYVGIAADCQYLLLTQITGTLPSGQNPTPEPAFYGILLLAMAALAVPAIRGRFVPEARS